MSEIWRTVMAKTRDGGFDVVATEWREAVSDAELDCVIQNPENTMLYLVLSDTQPAADFKGAHRVPPYKTWTRSDAFSVPVLQGKVWLRADKEVTVPITEVV